MGLALGARDPSRIRPFASWYARRLWRIYPALFLVVGVGTILLEGTWRSWGPLDFARALVWPTPYYFLAQITVFYLLYYALMRLNRPEIYRVAWIGLIPAYAALFALGFSIHWLSWVFYFQMMLLGGDLAGKTSSHPMRSLTALGILFPAYIGIKAMLSTGRLSGLAFLPHVLMFPMVVALVDVSSWETLHAAVAARRWLTSGVDFLASLTLEIYLVHDYVFKAPRVVGLPFPLNLVAFWTISLALAWVVGRVCGAMTSAGPKFGRPKAKLTTT